MLDMELSASMACARVIRGMQSMARALTPLDLALSTVSVWTAGCRKEMSVAPRRIISSSCRTTPAAWNPSWSGGNSDIGGRTFRTMSALNASAAVGTIVAPAAA